MKDMTKLLDYRDDDRVITSHEMAAQLKEEPQGFIVKSDIPGLDKVMNGFEAGELITVSGPTKSGKTLLCQTFTDSLVKQDEVPLWFSYELTNKQFLRCFDDLPKFVLPQKLKAASLPWLEERIAEAIAKYSSSVIFIDHLHFLFDMLSTNNASLQIGRVIRKLKEISITYCVVIVLLCHLTKADRSKEPSDTDIRDSGLIGAESDTVILIWRKPKKNGIDNEATLKLCYSRRTGHRDEYVNLIKVNSYLREKANISENGNGSLHDEIKHEWYQR